ncbi:hypothetical protein ACFWBF_00810 [Streptomyces sp. NPDC060028]|uniref:hypothetical protein n=1 Tax=Streptomyces sp. NPDC060028 TaxID=3347041 RepID=UPI0036B16C08
MTESNERSNGFHDKQTERHAAPQGWKPVKDLGTRLRVFGFSLLCVAVDFLFVFAWVWMHHQAESLFHWIGELPGLEGAVADGLKWLFTISTLAVLVAYVIRDVTGQAVQVWKAGG